eukprot:NODE_463_length_7125_cov_0.998292.p4 type:complete len:291 gc:universal NODE_463_length_7125_cov_0.998292:6709-5837(-)
MLMYLIAAFKIIKNKRKYNSDWYENHLLTMDDDEFQEHMRIPPNAFNYILNAIRQDWVMRIDARKALCIFLWHIATGENYRPLGQRFGFAKGSICLIVLRMAKLIQTNLFYEITVNVNEATLRQQESAFQARYGVENVVAAMDGTFIKIRRPVKFGERYYSGYKKGYGINTLAICDYDSKIWYINAGYPSTVNDSSILKSTSLYQAIKDGQTVFSIDRMILVDSAFEREEFILKTGGDISGSARTVVEQTFGQFKSKFRLFDKTMDTDVKHIPLLLTASVIVYNINKNFL